MPRNHFSGGLFHIVNRGSKKESIYFENEDYQRFLDKLIQYSNETKNVLIQYCLLPSHFHLLLKADSEYSISKLMLKLSTSHSRYFTAKYKYVGRIFQNHYRSRYVGSNTSLMIVSRYIHRNPIDYFHNPDALSKYRWSSYREFINTGKCEYISKAAKNIVLQLFSNLQEYKDFVEADEITVQKQLKRTVNAIMTYKD